MLPLLHLAQQGNPFAGLWAITIIAIVFAVAASIFWLWMLIDALSNEPTTADKLLWFLVIFFLHIVGAVIYFAIRRPARPPIHT